ncbi:tetraacyldisaccharide 4'-kinase [uncultured Parabacteroides sp.]|uniref:tetraacyldisaccharide 4'-kinase n=1 Tax=uncultured Parabacteroides sp. TaxID=512312 RepID=UPI0025E04A12|nr:tetraacyldisaccharide 4'-kinase [uncultured Parabacteroides sp.]
MLTNNEIKLNYYLNPISFLYGFGIWIRNKLFDWGILHSEQYSIPVICIGNLSVGGTGKTPHTEYIIQLLKEQHRIAVLSRGYKRKTSGFILADSQSSSQEIGDEPFQIKNKFPDILVAVDANRRRGIQNLLSLPKTERPEIILLDDAYQHRYVYPTLSIVLSDYHCLFYDDKLMPTGRLREPASGINRADIVVVTKCEEDMKPIDFRIIEENMGLRAHQLLFFTRIVYGEIEPVFPSKARPLSCSEILKEADILLISGIALPAPFINEVKKYSNNVLPAIFPDHHAFIKSDFKKLDDMYKKMASPGKLILTTEKDAARLKDNPLVPENWKQSLYYLPITIKFHNGQSFDEAIRKHIMAVQKKSIL